MVVEKVNRNSRELHYVLAAFLEREEERKGGRKREREGEGTSTESMIVLTTE